MDHQVEFLIIGGYALGAYIAPRYTKDLDIWVGRNKDNIDRLYKALSDFGFCFNNLDILSSTQDKMIILGNEPNRVDILNYAKGLSFDNSYKHKKTVKLSFLKYNIPFISKEDLIINKKIVGRLQDLADVEALLNS